MSNLLAALGTTNVSMPEDLSFTRKKATKDNEQRENLDQFTLRKATNK